MTRKAKAVVSGVAAAALLVLAGLYSARLALENPLAAGSAGRTVIVEPGDSLNAVAARLEEGMILDRPWLFKLAAYVTGSSARIQAGEYRVGAGDTHQSLIDRMVRGEVVQHYFTIIEGWTVGELLQALPAARPLVSTLQARDAEGLAGELALGIGHAEGWFFPDTYAYTRGETDADLLLRAHSLMQDRLQAAWAERAAGLPLDGPYEALILASIIERETGVDAERPVIAGVLSRRLEQRMRLQVDPTVIYGLGESYAGDITRAHLRDDTPYNTYTRYGLPPTPISLPGEPSLHAAVQPQPGEFLYYVASADLDGSHVFNKTLDGHNAAVAMLVRSQRARNGRNAPAQ